MTRERLPDRRAVWRQKVVIHDDVTGPHSFFVDFGEYPDGRLAEVFITASKAGTFVRGTLDALARGTSLALQSGAPPECVARMLLGLDYPPSGRVEAAGSCVERCSSIADYLGQEIRACYCGAPEEPEPEGEAAASPVLPAPPHRYQALADEWREPVLVLASRHNPIWNRVEQTGEYATLESQADDYQRSNATLRLEPTNNNNKEAPPSS